MTPEVLRSLVVIAGCLIVVGALLGATGMWLWLNRDRDLESIRRARRARAAHARLAHRAPARSATRWL